MKVLVDADLCAGHAECIGWAPDIFELGDDGKAVVKNVSPPESMWRNARAAATLCPAGAIIVEDD
jgi:ferredoxin